MLSGGRGSPSPLTPDQRIYGGGDYLIRFAIRNPAHRAYEPSLLYRLHTIWTHPTSAQQSARLHIRLGNPNIARPTLFPACYLAQYPIAHFHIGED